MILSISKISYIALRMYWLISLCGRKRGVNICFFNISTYLKSFFIRTCFFVQEIYDSKTHLVFRIFRFLVTEFLSSDKFLSIMTFEWMKERLTFSSRLNYLYLLFHADNSFIGFFKVQFLKLFRLQFLKS